MAFSLQKLAIMVLAIVVLIILAIGGPKLFEEVKKQVADVTEVEVEGNFTFGSEDVKGEKPELPKEHDSAITYLAARINEMLKSSKENCFLKYEPLPDLGEDGTVLQFVKEDKTRLFVYVKGQQERVVSFENMGLCVIREGEVPRRFEYGVTKSHSGEDGFTPDLNYYKRVDSVTIQYDTKFGGGLFNRNANRISYDEDFIDFNDHGYLFKADNGNICFFPTDDEGIRDFIFEDIDSGYENQPEKFRCTET